LVDGCDCGHYPPQKNKEEPKTDELVRMIVNPVISISRDAAK
jgi:hypothetical protein